MNFEEYVFPIILTIIFLILLIIYYWGMRKVLEYILKKLGINYSEYSGGDVHYESTFRAIADIEIIDSNLGKKILGYSMIIAFVLSLCLLAILFMLLGAFLLGYF